MWYWIQNSIWNLRAHNTYNFHATTGRIWPEPTTTNIFCVDDDNEFKNKIQIENDMALNRDS